MIGILGVILLLVLVLLKVQVGISLLVVGFLGYIFLTNTQIALSQLGMTAFSAVSNYSLSVIPMFILMGMLLSYSGLAKDLFKAVDHWIGHLRGGMAMATIGASAIFSSISGSVNATTATLAKVAIPEMERYKYDSKISTACVAAGGTLGILIPPSVILIIYGVLTMEPIAALLIGGLIPGIIMAVMFMITVYILIRKNPSLAPSVLKKADTKDRIESIKKIWPFIFIFGLSIGGLYLGWFTPTEAGAVGAGGALLLTLVTRRMNFKLLYSSLEESVRLTAMIFMILIGATLFGQFLAMSKLPMTISSYISGIDVSPYIILFLILLAYFILGLFMEGIAILVLTLPIIYPMIISLGFDGVWFGIIMVMMINMGLITPPLGISVYVIHGVVKHIPVQTIFRGVIPMLIAMIILTVVLVIFPEIVTFLPSRM